MKPHAFFHPLLAIISAVMLCGCEPPEIETLEPLEKPDAEVEQEVAVNSEVQPWWSSLELPFEVWYVQYLGGKRIGYYQTLIDKPVAVSEGITIESRGLFSLKPSPSASPPSINEFKLESQEDGEGNLVRFMEETTANGLTTVISGQLVADKMTLSVKAPESNKKSSVKWQPGTWGVLGIQSMLFSEPIEANQTRQCNIFVPQLGQIIAVELRAGTPEITSLPGGRTPELIPVDVIMQAKEGFAKSRNWVTENGLIEKTVAYNPTISTFRAPAEVAARFRDEMLLSRQLAASVPYEGNPPNEDDDSFAYLVEGMRDPYSAFKKSPRQQVRSKTALTTRVTVFNAPKSNDEETEPPEPIYSQASDLIQCEHSSIDKLAEDIVADLPPRIDQLQLAIGMTEQLSQRLENVEERAAISSALETARRMEGDNRGQAILLTALLRNRGIPARVALGLKLSDRNSRLRFFAWTEAWCQNQWISLDPMQGKRIGLDVLKMSDTGLADSNPYPEILQIYEKMQTISVKQEKQP